MKIFILGVLVICRVAAGSMETAVNIGGGSTNCGNVVHLHEGETVTIHSDVGKPIGYCGLVVHAMSTENHTCSGICVKVNSQGIDDCHSRLSVTEIAFSDSEKPPKELSCFEKLPNEFCFETTTMRTEVIRDLDYAATSYYFNLSVYSQCVDTSEYAQKQIDDEAARIKADNDKAYYAVVEGVVVGVCLAIIFLIVLAMTYCYYKNKAYRGPSLAGFKAKFSIKNGRNDKKTTDEAVPRYSKTKKEEQAPLVASTAAANTVEEPVVEIVDEQKANEATEQREEHPESSYFGVSHGYEETSHVPEVKIDEPEPSSPSKDDYQD